MKKFSIKNLLLTGCMFVSTHLFGVELECTFLNVGQGNGVVIKVKRPPKATAYMIVDFGSSSYKKELPFGENLKIYLKGKESGHPPKETTSSSPESLEFTDVSEPQEKKVKIDKEQKGSDAGPLFVDRLKEELEGALGPKGAVQTVVLTHEDSDHYNYLPKLIDGEERKIAHLILSGLPANYRLWKGDVDHFYLWLETCIKNKTKIYFPALKDKAITKVEELDALYAQKSYQGHLYSAPRQPLSSSPDFLKDAFNFGDGIDIHALTLNPTHAPGEHKEAVRLSDDTNAGSLILKLTHQNSGGSVILTGDATGVTTRRVLSNYPTQWRDFLKTDVLLASHHGAFTEDTNNAAWISATQPKVVIFSHGFKFGHPEEEAYKAFRASPRLQKVGEAKHLLVTGDKTSRTHYGTLHRTFRAMFSTATHGDITVSFQDPEGQASGMTLVAENLEGKIILPKDADAFNTSFSQKEEDETVPVTAIVENDEVVEIDLNQEIVLDELIQEE